MTTASATHQELTIDVAGGEVLVRKGGSGDPIFVIHHDIGAHDWTPFYDRLAERFTVYLPDLPGYGKSKRPEWARSVRDMVALAGLTLDELGLPTSSVVGLGFGGFLAAELATTAQARINKLTLAAAMGVKPEQGQIFDQFLVSHEDYVRTGFADESTFEAHFGEEADIERLMVWDINREMTTRVGWKPYMHNMALPYLLPSVHTSTLIVWGSEDAVVPTNSGALYAEKLPNARLEVLEGAGHWLELERPDDLARLIIEHEESPTATR